MATLPTIDEALALVLAHVRVLPAEEVALEEAAGRVLAADARAVSDLPPFRSSAMDGYALRSADAPGTLRAVGQSAAGAPWVGVLAAGETVAISTGAVVPDGADAVAPIEIVEVAAAGVTVPAVAERDNVREPGGDVGRGEVVLAAGQRVGAVQLGALAAAGIATVGCARRPRVAVVPTGSELRPPGSVLEPGQIYESNGLLLAARLAESGAVVERFETVRDDEVATREALERALAADVVVTSGGVSMGPHDLVRAALADLGVREVFWRVAVKPGKPVAFSVRGETLVFGLPGNPVSSLVGCELLVRPALAALQGAEGRPLLLPATLGGSVRRSPDRDQLVRARVSVAAGAVVAEPLRGQGSHMIVRAAAADALVLVPRGEGELAHGAPVSYVPL